MRNRAAATVALAAAVSMGAPAATAQSVAPVSVESAVSISQFAGENAAHRPDVVIDVTTATRLGKGWTAYVRPWLRKASTAPYELDVELYQAAAQYQRAGRLSTRVDLGYILSPIGLGMMDARPDTNPTITPHLSYLIPMPAFEPGVPPSLPIASSYPPGGQITVSTHHWDLRGAVLGAPPNRSFELSVEGGNPGLRPAWVVGGGVSPKTGVRLGVGYAAGVYAKASEITRAPFHDRSMEMVSLEGELAFGYTKVSGEVTRNTIDTAAGHAVATEWFVQGLQSLTPRWFASARHEGVNAPPRPTGAASSLRVTEAAAGFRLHEDFTVRTAFSARKTYFNPRTNRQVGVSLVWARRWR